MHEGRYRHKYGNLNAEAFGKVKSIQSLSRPAGPHLGKNHQGKIPVDSPVWLNLFRMNILFK